MTRPLSLLVAVPTYRRPAQLALLLPAVLAQLSGNSEILVVDNDPAGSAAAVATGLAGVRYVHEPRPGIAAVRNRAIDEAVGSDLLIFIDDDERPLDGWIDHLLATYLSRDCAAVVGPVIREFDREPPEWVHAGRFFDRPRYPTGTIMPAAGTGNLLLSLVEVRRLSLRFDERFGISGGSDTLFTKQLVGAGGSVVWCDEAVVVEAVPSSRLSREWILKRAFRSGNTWGRTTIALADGPAGRLGARIKVLAQGLPRAAGGYARYAYGTLVSNPVHTGRGLRTAWRGLGLALTAFGHTYQEYRRDEPSPVR